MSKTLTPRELLAQHPGQVIIKPVSRIEADLPLKDSALDRLMEMLEDDAIQGLEVITSEGEPLGFISSEAMLNYVETQVLEGQKMGGNIGQLGGDTITDALLFRCNLHTPPDEILIAIFRPNLLKCIICGKLMQLVE